MMRECSAAGSFAVHPVQGRAGLMVSSPSVVRLNSISTVKGERLRVGKTDAGFAWVLGLLEGRVDDSFGELKRSEVDCDRSVDVEIVSNFRLKEG